MAKDAKILRGVVTGPERTNALTKVTVEKRNCKKQSTVAEKYLNAVKAELKEVQDLQKQSVKTAKNPRDGLSMLLPTLQRLANVLRRSKKKQKTTNRFVDMRKHVAESKKATDNVLRQVIEMLKCVGLLERETLCWCCSLIKRRKHVRRKFLVLVVSREI